MVWNQTMRQAWFGSKSDFLRERYVSLSETSVPIVDSKGPNTHLLVENEAKRSSADMPFSRPTPHLRLKRNSRLTLV